VTFTLNNCVCLLKYFIRDNKDYNENCLLTSYYTNKQHQVEQTQSENIFYC